MKRRILIAVLAVLGLAAADAPDRLDLASFDYVWTTIRDRHFDPGLGGLSGGNWPKWSR